ncbi:MAG: hypothetical protein KDD02_17985 [Phaeodactylibacter sp.]|nr:hypothetical protein [Phaeodactylibacter sp.]MCB9303358.1 hypothetical protein [Lewinellaceae bacterium]HQU58051.1 hypothetical protein [Saprospiraceae bacterium]
MKAFKNIFFFLLLAGFPFILNAQNPDLPSEQVDIIKNFEARLGDAERYRLDPELPPLDTATRRQDYMVTSSSLEVEYLPPKIRPLAMPSDKESGERYDGYARLGAGFPLAFLGEGFYNISSVENFNLGLSAKHLSANNNKKIENQRFSYTNVGADGTYHFDQGFSVNGGLGYTSDVVHFYGYNDLNEALGENFSFEPEQVRQKFDIFEGHASIFNGARTEADFNYHAGLKFYLMNDDYAVRENGFDLLFSGTKWFDGSHPLTIELETDFTAYKDTANQSLNNFFLRPSYTYHGGSFTAKLGANIASHDDNFSFFPDVELSALLLDGVLGAYVGASGTLEKNSFRSLSDYNPYISSRIQVRNSSYYYYYGGVRGNVQGIDYDAQVGYKAIDNLALFLLPDIYDTIPRFDVLYDTASIFTIKASVSAPLFDGFTLTGTVSQNFFSLDREAKPWHLPSLTVNLGARYVTMEEKLTIRGDFFLENGVPYLNDDGDAQNLNGLFDISLGADYFFTKNIGGFVQVNNLANNKRQRWFRYPTFGLNAMVGIVARF